MWDGFEARKFPRVKADCQIYMERLAGEDSITTKTENIGLGGFSVVLSRALQKLSKIKIYLDLADGGQPISCEGRVVWTVASKTFGSDKLTHDTGVEFLDISQSVKERLKNLIKTTSPV